MNDLDHELWRLPIPTPEGARERAISAIATERARETSARRSARTRFAACAVAALAAVAAIGALTPMGRSAAAAVAEVVGIGDDSTIQDHPDQDGRSVVVGTGEAPGGTRYEMVAYHGKSGQSCLAMDWPTMGPGFRTSSTCLDEDPLKAPVWPFGASATDQLRPEAALTVYGLADPTVARVRVTYRGASGIEHEAPADLARVTGQLQEEAGTPIPIDYFVAFLPAEVMPSVEVTGFDDQGQPVARQGFPTESLRNLEPPFVPADSG